MMLSNAYVIKCKQAKKIKLNLVISKILHNLTFSESYITCRKYVQVKSQVSLPLCSKVVVNTFIQQAIN